jgi:NAD/NADP transhydrogenase alpha subunit
LAARVTGGRAGGASDLQDAEYQDAGATLVDKASALGADLVLKVRPPALDEAMQFKAGAM